MNDRSIARSIALGRVAFGLVMLLIPDKVLARVGDAPPGPLMWMARAFGIRDMILGFGAIIELTEEDPEGRWVAYGAAADTCDAVAAVVWREELGVGGMAATLSLAVPAAAGGWWSAFGLHRTRMANRTGTISK
ncbi:MAG: hypothetical protein WCJ04_04880 [Actinomycetes bacterium]